MRASLIWGGAHMTADGALRDLWPYLCRGTEQSIGHMQIDLATILLACAGLGVAVAFAILAGTVSARVFFDATRGEEEPAPSASRR